MAVTTERLTAEQYLELPPDGRRTELIDGEIVVNEPRARHQRIAGFICHRLWVWIDEGADRGEALMPVNLRLGPEQVYAPDACWFDQAHALPGDRVAFTDPPQLAVEVRSDSTWRFDVGRKRQIYEAAGVSELWLVDTASDSVLAYRRSSPAATLFDIALEVVRGDQLTSRQLPGFALGIDDLSNR